MKVSTRRAAFPAAGLRGILLIAFIAGCAGPGPSGGPSTGPSASASTADLSACEAVAPENPKDPALEGVFEEVKAEVQRRAPELNSAYLNGITGVIVIGAAHPTAELCNELHELFGPHIWIQDTGPSIANAGRADWWVDPASLPLAPDSTDIHGFLQERNCASGKSPEGRIVGPTIEFTAASVIVTFKVMSTGGTCQSNPRFPVTVHLTEPLGSRDLLDGGVIPPRDAFIDPTVVLAPTEDCGPLVGTNDTKSACLVFLNETLGDQYEEYASFQVRPADGACAGDECTTAAGIEAHTWTIVAVELAGPTHRWTCTYADEVATCTLFAD